MLSTKRSNHLIRHSFLFCQSTLQNSAMDNQQPAEPKQQKAGKKKQNKKQKGGPPKQQNKQPAAPSGEVRKSYLQQNHDLFQRTGLPMFPPPDTMPYSNGHAMHSQPLQPGDYRQAGAPAGPSAGSSGDPSPGAYIPALMRITRDNTPEHIQLTNGHATDQGPRRTPGKAPQGPHASPNRSNIVPFRTRGMPWPHGREIPPDYRDVNDSDTRPVLLFDLNGTITVHTSKRRSAGINKPRPGTVHLRRLLDYFRLGVFTSSGYRTVQTAIEMLEKAAGPGPKIFNEERLILFREQTMEVHKETHCAAGGKSWDTVKPLHPYFKKLHRVLLLDDDSFKAYRGQEDHMLLVPVWRNDDHEDDVVRHLVDVLLEVAAQLRPDEDLSKLSGHMKRLLWQRCGRTAEDEAIQKAQHEDASVAVYA